MCSQEICHNQRELGQHWSEDASIRPMLAWLILAQGWGLLRQFSPFRYFPNWKYLTYTFAKSKFPVTEKLTNGALVTPTPVLAHYSMAMQLFSLTGCIYLYCYDVITSLQSGFNTLRPRQNGHRFADDTFKRIFLNGNVRIWLRFHWSLFLRVQLTIFQHWLR